MTRTLYNPRINPAGPLADQDGFFAVTKKFKHKQTYHRTPHAPQEYVGRQIDRLLFDQLGHSAVTFVAIAGGRVAIRVVAVAIVSSFYRCAGG